MKNIHVLPTVDKPSRLCKDEFGKFYVTELMESKVSFFKNQNIYITSDEEIREGDLYLDIDINKVCKNINPNEVSFNIQKKIILTTDHDLIKDCIQAISDEFLEWFVKNPSCEEVEVVKIKNYKGNYFDCFHTQGQCDCGLSPCKQMFFTYKIIIPKEEPKQTIQEYEQQGLEKHSFELEPKQETLEEASTNYANKNFSTKDPVADEGWYASWLGFRNGAKWQQERSYSEEEVLEMLNYFGNEEYIKQWFEQFKKK